MDNDLHEALSRAFSPKGKRDKPRFVVMESMYAGKRVIFSTDSQMEANRIASQHAGRTVVVNP